MSNELAKQDQQNQALAARGELPEYILRLRNAEGYREDAGELDAADVGVNTLRLIHGTSAESKPNWDGNGAAPLPQGTMILSKSHTIVPPGTTIVPLLRNTVYIHFKGKGKDRRVLHVAHSATDPKILECNGLAWGTDEKGESIPPIYTKIVSFWVITKFNMDEPAVMSFQKTALKQARTWTQDLVRVTLNWELPLYISKFILDEPHWATNGTDSWPQFVVRQGGPVPEKMLPILEASRQTAKKLYSATSPETLYKNTDEAETEAGASAPTETLGDDMFAKGQQPQQQPTQQQPTQQQEPAQQQPAQPAQQPATAAVVATGAENANEQLWG